LLALKENVSNGASGSGSVQRGLRFSETSSLHIIILLSDNFQIAKAICGVSILH